MSQLASKSDIIPLAKEAGSVATSLVHEAGSTMRHRQEHPAPLPTKSTQANNYNFSLINYAPAQNDNRDMTNSTNVSNTPENTMVTGKGANSVALAAGVGAAVVGGMLLYSKIFQKERRPQKSRRTAMPGFERGRIVAEDFEDGEEEEEEEEEEEYVDLTDCK